MKVLFEDKDLEELINTGQNRKYKKYARDPMFMKKLRHIYNIMRMVPKASELEFYGKLLYEKLKYQYSGKSSVRVMYDRVERIIFEEIDDGIIIKILDLDDTHYGNKK